MPRVGDASFIDGPASSLQNQELDSERIASDVRMSSPAPRLSLVERSRSGDEETRRRAYATIIDAYWKPAYKYLRLKWLLSPDEAAQLTQEFFATVLERAMIANYDPARTRFRTYVRLCLDGFASQAHMRERGAMRGGGDEIVSLDFISAEGEVRRHGVRLNVDDDELFYREWADALRERSLLDLKRHVDAAGQSVKFDVFARYDLIDDVATRPTYAEIARALDVTPATVTNHLAAMRRQYRSILLERLRELTSSDEEWEAEAAELLNDRP